MRLLCTSLCPAMIYWLTEGTLSKTDGKKGDTKKLEEKMLHSDKDVQDWGLVVVDLKARDIKLEHRSYCSKKMKEMHFSGDVLGYITPDAFHLIESYTAQKINSHGYDIAKIFGNKFTLISPVWLQVKRRGKESFQFTGLHDADKGWMKDVRKTSKTIKIVLQNSNLQEIQSAFTSRAKVNQSYPNKGIPPSLNKKEAAKRSVTGKKPNLMLKL